VTLSEGSLHYIALQTEAEDVDERHWDLKTLGSEDPEHRSLKSTVFVNPTKLKMQN
jgi:hypothetical protein